MLTGEVHPTRLRPALRAALPRGRADQPLRFQTVVTLSDATLMSARGLDGLHLSWTAFADGSGPGSSVVDKLVARTARIARAAPLPVLVDIGAVAADGADVGATVEALERAGAAGNHIDDRILSPAGDPGDGSTDDLVACIRAATAARRDEHFLIGTRALPYGRLIDTIDRARACVSAGADVIVVDAPETIAAYLAFRAALEVPLLADTTVLPGTTPPPTLTRLARIGMDAVIHPITPPRPPVNHDGRPAGPVLQEYR